MNQITNQDFDCVDNDSNFNIDLSYLKEFSHGDRAFEKEMLESSVTEIEEKLLLLEKYVNGKNYEHIKAVAHSLKSLMPILGNQHLYQCFYKIEHYEEEMDKSFIEQYFYFIIKNWNEIKRKVEQKIEVYSIEYECVLP